MERSDLRIVASINTPRPRIDRGLRWRLRGIWRAVTPLTWALVALVAVGITLLAVGNIFYGLVALVCAVCAVAVR